MRRALYMPIDWFDRLGHDASGCERGAWRQTATSASPSDRASGLLLHPPAVFGVHRGHAIIYMKRVGCTRPADECPPYADRIANDVRKAGPGATRCRERLRAVETHVTRGVSRTIRILAIDGGG